MPDAGGAAGEDESAARAILPPVMWTPPAIDAAALGGATGAYGLVAALGVPLRLRLGRRAVELAPGRYLYGGSARGPGGLGARLVRHGRVRKPLRWHVDRLTAAARIELAVALPGADECAVVAQALALPGAAVAAAGFGASDCRRCAAHLVRLPESADAERILAQLTPLSRSPAVVRLAAD